MSETAVLVFPPRFSDSARVLSEASTQHGLRSEAFFDWRIPAELRRYGTAHLYAAQPFADAVAGRAELTPLQPTDNWLASLDPAFLGHKIHLTTVVEANMPWASGHYATDPDRVLEVVLQAFESLPTGRDAPFACPVPTVRR